MDTYSGKIKAIKVKRSNAPRLYFTLVGTDFFDDAVQGELEQSGVNEVLILLGASDKHNQLTLLGELTGMNLRALSATGAGSN